MFDPNAAINEIMSKFHAFVKSTNTLGFPRKWLSADGVEVYIRVIIHQNLRCIEMGNIQFATDLDMQNSIATVEQQDFIKKFLDRMHEANPLQATSIDEVSQDWLAGWLLLNGWVVSDVMMGSVRYFYKLKYPNYHWQSYQNTNEPTAQQRGMVAQ